MSECENCEQLDYAAIIGDAARMERKHIIKLLEADMNYLTEAIHSGQVDVVPGIEHYRKIIEKIKARGENK